jgi:hypothetical protein
LSASAVSNRGPLLRLAPALPLSQCGATRERQHDKWGGGAPSKVVSEAAVHRFITQQPTLFECIPGRVRGDFYNDDNCDDNDQNEDDNNMYDDYILIILHNNQPWLDAFLADWGVMFMMMIMMMATVMTIRTETMTMITTTMLSMEMTMTMTKTTMKTSFCYATTNLKCIHFWKSGGDLYDDDDDDKDDGNEDVSNDDNHNNDDKIQQYNIGNEATIRWKYDNKTTRIEQQHSHGTNGKGGIGGGGIGGGRIEDQRMRRNRRRGKEVEFTQSM